MTIVLLHGFCEDHNVWKDLLSLYKQKDLVKCIDLPGFGDNSIYYKQAETTVLMADFVNDEIMKLNLPEGEKIILIGHSLGGYVTLAFAQKYPKLLAGVGLFHSSATPDSEERKANRMKTIEFVKANGAEAYHRVLMPGLFKDNTDPKVIESAIAMAKTAKEEGIIAALLAMRNRQDRLDVLETFEKPILFIAGEKDSLIPKNIILDQAALCKTAMVEVLTDSAHMGMIEEPKMSAEILEKFVSLINGVRELKIES